MESKLFDLKGKTALITGGNGGIGFGMAVGLAEAGANIIIAARNKTKTDESISSDQLQRIQIVILNGFSRWVKIRLDC